MSNRDAARRMESPVTRWQDDDDKGYWIRSVIIFVAVAVIGGGVIWLLNMLLDKIFGVGG